MENNNLFSREKRKGFTIVEMAIVILILGIMASVMTFSPEIAKQTPKREAERLQMYINRMKDAADRRHMNFDIEVGPVLEKGKSGVNIRWANGKYEEPKFEATAGFSYSSNFSNNGTGTYNAKNKQFNSGATITVKNADGEVFYFTIASTEGRTKVSDSR